MDAIGTKVSGRYREGGHSSGVAIKRAFTVYQIVLILLPSTMLHISATEHTIDGNLSHYEVLYTITFPINLITLINRKHYVMVGVAAKVRFQINFN